MNNDAEPNNDSPQKPLAELIGVLWKHFVIRQVIVDQPFRNARTGIG
jgi:hypothetical protein